MADSYYSTTNTMWVLLGGENSVIPIRFGAASINTNSYHYTVLADLYYSDFTGDWDVDHDYYSANFDAGDGKYENLANKPRYGEPYNIYGLGDNPDYYPEVFIGRLLVSSAEEIDTWTNKYFNYVLYPNNGNFTYLGNTLHTQADQMQWYPQFAPSQADLIDDITESFWTTTIVEENVDQGEATYPEASDIIDFMNDNDYGLILFSNHGGVAEITVASYDWNKSEPRASLISYWPDFDWDAGLDDNLEVKNTPFIVYSIACDIGGFDYDFSWSSILKHGFIEAFIVEDNLNAVAVAGNTRYGYWDTSFDLEESFFNAIVDDDNYNDYPCRKMGVGVVASKVENTHTYLDYSNNYFGDPEMNIWVGIPSQLSNASVTVNSSNIVVNAGVSGCDICVSSGDNGSSYYLAVSDKQSYTFSTSVRLLYITITKPHYIPYTAVTGGTFSSNETWFGVLRVLGNVSIASGYTLNIKEGTKILFDSGKQLTAYGTINASGTSDNPLIFTRSDPSSTSRTYWYGIYVPSGGVCNLNNFEMYGANYGIYLSYGSGSISNGYLYQNDKGVRSYYTSNLTVSKCTFKDDYYGIYAYSSSNMDVISSTIENCTYGVYLNTSSLDFQKCNIKNNTSGGIYTTNKAYLNMDTFRNVSNPFTNNRILNNYSFGVYISSNSGANLGYFVDMGAGVAGGFNIFTRSSSYYDVKNYSSSTIMAQVNQWTSMNNYGSVTTYPTAADRGFVLSKSNSDDNPDEIETLFRTIYQLERDSLYTDAIKVLNSIADLAPDHKISNLVINGMFRLYQKIGDLAGLIENLDNLIVKYPKNAIGIAALDYSVTVKTIPRDYKDALARSDRLIDIYKKYGSTENQMAWALYEQGQIIREMEKQSGDLAKSTGKSSVDIFAMILENYPESEAAEAIGLMDIEIDPEAEKTAIIPRKFALKSAYPNPFNPKTTISFNLPEEAQVEIIIYDLMGREVWKSAKTSYSAGTYSVIWSGTNHSGQSVSTGIYLIRLNSPKYCATRKVLLIK